MPAAAKSTGPASPADSAPRSIAAVKDSESVLHFSRVAERLIADFRGVPDESSGRMRRRPTRAMAGLVEDLLVKYQVGRPSVEQTIRDHWAELVGAPNAAYSHATQIDARGRLAILTTHAVVRNELFLNRQLIVDRIRALPGCAHVRSLQFRSS